MKSSLPRLPTAVLAALAAAATAMSTAAAIDDPAGDRGGSASAYTVRHERNAGSAGTPGARPDRSENLPPGDRLVVQAMNYLERRGSVTARLAHQIHLNASHFTGTGGYWQQGSGDALRVRMELVFNEHNARLLQVTDGSFLWVDQQLPTGRNVSRINLDQIRAETSAAAAGGGTNLGPGEASWSPLEPELSAHAGGLPSLLVALSKNFSFLPPQAMRLDLAGSGGGEAAKIPVFAVVGHWKPERLRALVPQPPADESAAAPSGPPAIPARIPQEVLLLVGQTDLFPYRVEFRRLEAPAAVDQKGAVIPYQISTRPIAVLSFSDVTFDTPIANGQFDYNAGDVDWTDRTAERLERLRR
jgi:hypothetical protein